MLTDLIGIIADSGTRTAGVLYVNDLPDISFDKLKYVANKVTGSIATNSNTITNISLNTSNFTVGDSVKGKNIPDGSVVASIVSSSSITINNYVREGCNNVELVVEAQSNFLFDNIIELASKQILNDVMMHLQGCMSFNSILENDILGFFDEQRNLNATENKWRGQQVIIDRYPNLEFYVSKIRLFFNTAITSNIYVWDVGQGKLLDTIPFTSVANQITDVDINKSYVSYKQRLNLAFLYDGNLTGSFRTKSNRGGNGCTKCGFRNSYLLQNGVQLPKTSAVLHSNFDKSGENYGMSLTYSLNCSLDNFLNSIRNLLQFPMLYLVASMIMKHAKYNERINSYIVNQKSDHSILAQKYEDEYKMMMFGSFNENGQKIKQGLLDSMKLPNDVCFKKRHKIEYKTQIP
jgi:hypothetical protein